MSAYQRRKGARGEIEAAHFLGRVFPDAHRRACGEESQDRRGVDLDGCYPFAVQVKVMAHPNPLAALREACAGAMPSEIPCAYVRQVAREKRGSESDAAIIFRAADARWLIAVFEKMRATMPRRVEEIRGELEAGKEP